MNTLIKYAVKDVMSLMITLVIGIGTAWPQDLSQRSTPETINTSFVPKPFTINSSGDRVFFSQGNLQYIGSADVPYWKFADHQWDYLGTTTGQNSSNQNVDRDLFGWGTSGYNHGAACYQPWSTSTSRSDYYAYGQYYYNLYNQTGKADWGYNAISNSGNSVNKWRTLTHEQWAYVFNTRNTSSGIRYAKAKVNNVNGVILLPDDWNTSYYTLNNTNSGGANYSGNTITANVWENSLESHGAVFLPAAGFRFGTSVNYVGSRGYYWSASYDDGDYARNVDFDDTFLYADYEYRDYGQSVRLVRFLQNCSIGINASPSPAEGGAVSGSGAYGEGAVCTLTATPSAGYAFACWTEEGTVVSTNATYTFTALWDRNLVANFASASNISFADPNVKALCVANWDTNGDGELSYAEAAMVTSLGDVFKNNTTIHSFNELSHFILLSSIDAQAFYGCTELTQVTIPAYVKQVGDKAFWNCPALQTVYFNAINCNSMQSTYNSNTYSVFSSNSSGAASALTRVVVGNQVTCIPAYAFSGSSDIYQRLVIPASVALIGDYAFDGCSSIPLMLVQGNGLLSIGNYAFRNCSALASALNLPNSVISVGQYAFYGCTLLPSLTIGEGVATIGSYAFWNCPNLTTVHFNATNCTNMNTNSQYSVFNSGTSNGGATPIVTLTIGDNVTTIPDYSFRNSTSMTSVITIPDATTTIGQYAFHGAQSAELTIGEGITTIGGYAFWNCPNLTTVHFNATNCTTMNSKQYSVFNSGTSNGGATPIVTLTIGDNVTTIPDYSFRNSTSMTSVITIPDATTTIGQYAFHGAQSAELTIGEGITTIGSHAFWNCPNLTTVHFNATNCTTMNGDRMYSVFNSGTSNGGATPIVTLTIGDNVTTIPDYAFRYGSNMANNLIIPNSVTNIGQYAFANCTGQSRTLLIGNNVISIGQYAFDGCNGFTGDLVIPNSVTSLGVSAFRGCSGFNGTLILPANESFNTIHSYTFAGCSGLMGTLTIPDNVTEVAQYAFQDCSSFTGALVLHDAMTTIGSYAFNGCSNIPELTIGEGITSIGGWAFWNCPNLTTVHFNATNCTTMNSAPYSVFNSGTSNGGATPIVTLTIGDNVTRIPAYAFRYSSNMTCDIIIPNAVTTIDQYAFANCTGQSRTLLIGNNVISIGQYAFDGCNGFTGDLVIPNSVTSLGEYAFRGCSGFNGSLVLGSGVSTINPYTFAGCSGFTKSLIIGRAVASIGNYAFQNCSAFTSLISENPAPITATDNSFIGMTYTIPVHVPFGLVGNYRNATGWKLFTNYREQYTFDAVGMDNDHWSDAQNWYTFELPGDDDVVCVNSDCQMDIDAHVLRVYVLNLNDAFTVNSDQTLDVNYGIGVLQASQLVLEDGCQLYNNLPGQQATINIGIGGYDRDGGGWFTIATPIYGGMAVSSVTNGAYDLYAYDEPAHYWRNQKVADNHITTLKPAQGYLYANQSSTSLSFSGTINPSNAQFSVPVTYEGSPLAGYTLLGNPYTNNLNINDVKLNGTPLTTYYKINGGSELVAYTAGTPIRPCEGFLVMAPEGGTITFEPTRDRTREVETLTMKGEDEMLRGFRLPEHLFLLDVDAFQGESQSVSITASVNATEGGTVTGGGTYAIGSTCTLTATPNECYSFVNWTLNGQPVSTSPTYTFTVMGAGTYTANFEQTSFVHSTLLASGWNWWSTYIELGELDGLTLLENSLGSHGLRIVSQGDGYVEPIVIADQTYWFGTLSQLANEQMYKLKTDAAFALPFTGPMATPANHPITIHSGWNWIGYPCQQNTSLNTALASFVAEQDDIIKSYNSGYATYYDGAWVGSLTTFEPGKGYMYKSNSNNAKSLVFQAGRESGADSGQQPATRFKATTSPYMDNMTVTAVVEVNGEEVRADDYEVAAFVGEECRGVARLSYVEALDRYIAFLTVYGDTSEPMSLVLTDGHRASHSDATLLYEADAALGTLTAPVALRFGSLEVAEYMPAELQVYPNPFNHEILVEGTGVRTIEVFNVMGQRVFATDADGAVTRINLSHCAKGVYLLRVHTDSDIVTNHIIKE